jgi:hypothetical protein
VHAEAAPPSLFSPLWVTTAPQEEDHDYSYRLGGRQRLALILARSKAQHDGRKAREKYGCYLTSWTDVCHLAHVAAQAKGKVYQYLDASGLCLSAPLLECVQQALLAKIRALPNLLEPLFVAVNGLQ